MCVSSVSDSRPSPVQQVDDDEGEGEEEEEEEAAAAASSLAAPSEPSDEQKNNRSRGRRKNKKAKDKRQGGEMAAYCTPYQLEVNHPRGHGRKKAAVDKPLFDAYEIRCHIDVVIWCLTLIIRL